MFEECEVVVVQFEILWVDILGMDFKLIELENKISVEQDVVMCIQFEFDFVVLNQQYNEMVQ